MNHLRHALIVVASLLSLSSGAAGQQAPIQGKLYVTSWFGGVVSVIDLSKRAVTEEIRVGVQNHNVVLAPSQSHAWVTNNNAGTVSVIDTATDKVAREIRVGHGPRHTYFSPDGKEAYVTNEFDDTVSVVNVATYEAASTIRVGMMPHFALVVGDRLFITNFGSGDVSVARRRERDVIKTVAVGFGPLGAGATRDGKRVYVACHNANHVAVIDTDSLEVVARIPTDAGPVQVTVAPNQRFAYVANDGQGSVQKIDLTTDKIVKTIAIAHDAGSHGIGFADDGKVLLVTNTGTSTVSIIDTQNDVILSTVKVAAGPEGLAFKRP